MSRRPQENADARIIFVDAITDVGPDVMDQLPELKMIHSEGVGYNCIDCQAARERGSMCATIRVQRGIGGGAHHHADADGSALRHPWTQRRHPGAADPDEAEGHRRPRPRPVPVCGGVGGLWRHRPGHRPAAGQLRLQAILLHPPPPVRLRWRRTLG